MRAKKIYYLIAAVLSIYLIIQINDIEIDLLWTLSPSVTVESLQIACYENTSYNDLASILQEYIPKNTSIFFVETSCHHKYLKLTARQACAIESAALLNPLSNVYLLLPSPIEESKRLDSHTKPLLSYKNIKFLHIDMGSFIKHTPLEKWYSNGGLKSSRWPRSHASDILRYTALWKFGGIYLDLDVVLLKSFNGLSNFAGAESPKAVAAGVLSFSHGFPLADIAINDLRNRFKGYIWGYNGPGVITRSLKKFCSTLDISEMKKETCHGFTVYPPSAFYPIHWKRWQDYFVSEKKVSDNVISQLNDSFAVHIWNKFSSKTKVILGLGQPYERLASRFCPRVYSSLGGNGNTL